MRLIPHHIFIINTCWPKANEKKRKMLHKYGTRAAKRVSAFCWYNLCSIKRVLPRFGLFTECFWRRPPILSFFYLSHKRCGQAALSLCFLLLYPGSVSSREKNIPSVLILNEKMGQKTSETTNKRKFLFIRLNVCFLYFPLLRILCWIFTSRRVSSYSKNKYHFHLTKHVHVQEYNLRKVNQVKLKCRLFTLANNKIELIRMNKSKNENN